MNLYKTFHFMSWCFLCPPQVANTPGVSTDSVAELTVALLLMTARRLSEGLMMPFDFYHLVF